MFTVRMIGGVMVVCRRSLPRHKSVTTEMLPIRRRGSTLALRVEKHQLVSCRVRGRGTAYAPGVERHWRRVRGTILALGAERLWLVMCGVQFCGLGCLAGSEGDGEKELVHAKGSWPRVATYPAKLVLVVSLERWDFDSWCWNSS